MKTVSGECNINWTIKQMSDLSPSCNQDNIWWMLYHWTELSSKCLPCHLHPMKTVSGECNINWTMKQMSDLSPSSRQDIAGECSINWTMKQMSDFTVSFVQTRQSLVNALSTELWSKCMPCLFRPIKTVPGTCSDNWTWSKCLPVLLRSLEAGSGKCSINWTMKQMPTLSPSSNQGSLWYMLY